VPATPEEYPVDLLDYELPPELIAQQPLPARDASRLLVANRADNSVSHRAFRELPELLPPGALIVINDSRVMHSRYPCVRAATGGKVEVLLTRIFDDGTAECLTRTRGKLQPGEALVYTGGFSFEVLQTVTAEEPGRVRILLHGERPDERALRELLTSGELPLPPYIKEELADGERYQTSYAEPLGSSAAPTAGLHFTDATFAALARQDISVARITLHVGSATFLPIRGEDASGHYLSPESYFIFPPMLQQMLAAKLAGRPIVAVGTTAIRTLEWVFRDWRKALRSLNAFTPDDLLALPPEVLCDNFDFAGETSLYLLPGYRFKFVDALLTNFHLPRTTLLALVYAFGGRDLVRRAYDEAVAQRYRFYSLGDAMLVL
jgi:S-adenosylmethionine:tRNA ribosyltransferase-isomerase